MIAAILVGVPVADLCMQLAWKLRFAHANTGQKEFGVLGFGIAAWFLCFVITLAVLNRLARRRWQAQRFPKARVLS